MSVVIPCYNAARFLRETLQSVLAQTHAPREILLVDDGSTDGSGELAAGLGEPSIRVVRQSNQGECAARNTGLEEARGAWIAFLDADDRWEPTKLEQQVRAAAAQKEVICVHTGAYLFGPGVMDRRTDCPAPPEVVAGRYEVETLLLTPIVNTSTAMVRAGLPVRFPTWARQGGDMIFFAELSELGRFRYVDEPLAGYRMHADQVTRRADAWVSHFQNRFRWLALGQSRLGAERAARLRALLRAQVVEWLRLARWNRQWDRYWRLRAYGRTLEWPEGCPYPLRELVLPRFVYRCRDWLGDLPGRLAKRVRLS